METTDLVTVSCCLFVALGRFPCVVPWTYVGPWRYPLRGGLPRSRQSVRLCIAVILNIR